MSKEKEGKGKSDKSAPTKNLKEKRAEKAAKKKDKYRSNGQVKVSITFYKINNGKQRI